MEFYEQTPQDELRAITALGQHLSINEIELLVDRNRDVLKKYIHEFPELETLEYYLAERTAYLKNREDIYYQYFTYRSMTPELKEIHKKIVASHRDLRRKIYILIKTISELKKQGFIKPEEPNPDRDSLHFQAAQELAQRLVSLWFVERVVLFGSVAKGDFRVDSDIDICLGMVPKWISSYLCKIVDWVSAEVEEKYRNKIRCKKGRLFDLLRDKRDVRKMGFLEAGYLLAENSVYSFSLDKGSYTFNKNDVVGYSIKNSSRGNFICSVFYPSISSNTPLGYRGVFVLDCDAVALFSVTMNPCPQGYELKAELEDVSSALLEKYELDGNVFEILLAESVHEAAERIHKDSIIYMP